MAIRSPSRMRQGPGWGLHRRIHPMFTLLRYQARRNGRGSACSPWKDWFADMSYRSWLFVPGDSENKLGKSLESGADVIVVDLDASVAIEAKALARRQAAQWLQVHRQKVLEHHEMGRWVRINSLDSGLWRDDLVEVMKGGPDGIVLPRAADPEAVRQIAAEIYELEQRNQVAPGSTRILPLVSDSAPAAMAIPSYTDAPHQRLAGLGWGAGNLAASIGATRLRDKRGGWSDAFRLVRAQTLLAAHACGLMAIDALHADFTDEKGLKEAARDARADGFTGMFAIHPGQVPAINEAFAPGDEEIEDARRITAAFEDNPTARSLRIDGRIVDQAQLNLARRTQGFQHRAVPESSRRPILRPA